MGDFSFRLNKEISLGDLCCCNYAVMMRFSVCAHAFVRERQHMGKSGWVNWFNALNCFWFTVCDVVICGATGSQLRWRHAVFKL